MALTPEMAQYDTDGNGKLEGPEVLEYIKSSVDATSSTNTTNNPKSGTSTTTSRTKLTNNTARALMEASAKAAGYTGKFTSSDIAQFIKDFDKEQSRQIEKVIVSTSQNVTPGGSTADAVDKTMENTAKTEYPSLFNPSQFASDWVWNKINFKDEESLSAGNLETLAQVRGLVDQFNLFGVSDRDMKVAAKSIAKGDMTLAEYTVTLQKIAGVEYPQFADRFSKDPELTMYDIASPIVKMLAKTWQMEEKDIDWKSNPIVMSYTNYAGADGKGTPPSYYDLLLKARNDPKYDLTQEANENAREAATSLGRALGYGV